MYHAVVTAAFLFPSATVLAGLPLSVFNLRQPWHELHLALQILYAVPWAGLIRTALGKGPNSPQGGLKHLNLFTYILKTKLGIPESKWPFFAIWRRFCQWEYLLQALYGMCLLRTWIPYLYGAMLVGVIL